MRRAVIAVLVLVIAFALLVGLHPISPTRTFDDYQHKAKDTAESVLSSVQTARLAARTGTQGDAFGPYVSVLLSESDKGSGHRGPPPARARGWEAVLRDQLGYAEGTVEGPWVLRKLFARPPVLVPWDAIVDRDRDRIVVERRAYEAA